MRNSISTIRMGRELPRDLVAPLDGNDADAVYAVRVEKLSPEDAAVFLRVRKEVQEGIADLESGNVIDAEELYGELRVKYGLTPRK